MQVLKRNVLQQTQTGMRPRSQRLRSTRKIQFSTKRKAQKRQKEITGFYRVLRNLQNDEGAECRRNACIPIAEADQSCTKCNDKQGRNRSQKAITGQGWDYSL